MKAKIIFFALLLTASYACTKQKDAALAPQPELKVATGKIVFTGIVPADGCEYVFYTDKNEEIKLVNLSPEFAKDGLEVSVSYTESKQKFTCGIAQMTTGDIVKIDLKK